jgi:hypothetical protein
MTPALSTDTGLDEGVSPTSGSCSAALAKLLTEALLSGAIVFDVRLMGKQLLEDALLDGSSEDAISSLGLLAFCVASCFVVD